MPSSASCAPSPTTRRCSSRASRSASCAPVGAAGPHRQLEPRQQVGNLEVFRQAQRQGLTMYGQMTAGSWIYIGTQGVSKNIETFAEAARRHFGGSLQGRVTLTAGLGGMGGAQPLAVTMNEGVCLAIEVDAARARRRLDIGYVDRLRRTRPRRSARRGRRDGRRAVGSH